MKVEQIKVGFMDNFTYLVYALQGGEAVIVDPGFDAEEILARAKKLGLKITKIINTHSHPDHLGAALDLKEKTKAPIYLHKKEKEIMLSSYIPQVDDYITGRKNFKIDGEIMKVINTPGHTPGSISLAIDGGIFTGDTLFVGGCGRCDLPGSNYIELFMSLQKLKSFADETIIYPGHDYGPQPVSTIGQEKKNNPFFRVNTLNEFLSAQMP